MHYFDPERCGPDVVGWETTLRCNMRCRHCGSTAGDPRGSELNTAEALELCEQITALGPRRVVLTGGETLLRPDWAALCEALLAGGPAVGLLTNGWTLTERGVEALARFAGTGLYVSISIDGDAAEHDQIRGLDGSFERAFHGGQALRDAGVPVCVITTMSRVNMESLPALRERVLGELRPYAWQLQVTTPFGRAAMDDAFAIDPVDYVRLACFACETRRLGAQRGTEVFAGDCLGYCSSLDPGLRDEPWQGCGAGERILGIRSNGDVIGCLSIVDDRYLEGSVRSAPLAALWRRPGAFPYTRAFDPAALGGICAGCPEGNRCRGGCTANSISVYDQPHRAPYCVRAFEELSSVEAPGPADGQPATGEISL